MKSGVSRAAAGAGASSVGGCMYLGVDVGHVTRVLLGNSGHHRGAVHLDQTFNLGQRPCVCWGVRIGNWNGGCKSCVAGHFSFAPRVAAKLERETFAQEWRNTCEGRRRAGASSRSRRAPRRFRSP